MFQGDDVSANISTIK